MIDFERRKLAFNFHTNLFILHHVVTFNGTQRGIFKKTLGMALHSYRSDALTTERGFFSETQTFLSLPHARDKMNITTF